MVKCVCSVLTEHLGPKIGAKKRKEKKRKEKEKKRKENQINHHNKKAESYTAPWADLPGQLCNERNYYRHVRFSYYYYNAEPGITKIWRADSRGSSSSQISPYRLHLLRQSNDVDPYSSSEEQFEYTNSIRSSLDGKCYGLSLQGTLGVFEAAKISILKGVRRAIPSVCCKGFREYLVNSGRDVLLVFLVSRKSMNVVEDVEVYRLNFKKEEGWIKIESIGDLTMFLGSK